MMISVIALASFFLASPHDGIISSTVAFPTGAGGCPGRQAAIGGAHLQTGVVNVLWLMAVHNFYHW
jgi:hypothetical protein